MWIDKVVIVSGGAHRLGKAMALTIAKLGANVAITYHASSQQADQTCAEIEALGREALAVRCNQARTDEIKTTVDKVHNHFGRIDGLVNSASVFVEKDFFEVDPEGWDWVLAVNTRGPFFFTQYAAEYMLAEAGGAIVNIIDESVIKPNTAYPHHTISKAGLWSLTQLTALRLAPSIRVNAILPGAVLKPPDWDDSRWEEIANHIPLKKLGSPDDVCQALEYLLCAEFITGQMIVVEGGATLY